jgi:D-3-phosphoglycerate dehydrogenase
LKKKRVVVADHVFATLELEAQMAAANGAEFEDFSCATEEATIAAARGANVVFVAFAPITRAVLKELSPGATVIRYGIGYDNVDIEALRELKMQLANVPDYGVSTVANHASASLLTLLRRIPIYDALIKENGWAKPNDVVPIKGFNSTVIGLVGFGRIAQAVKTRLEPFGFSFVAHDPYCPAEVFRQHGMEHVSLEELARRADAVTLHVPGSVDTHHIINAAFLHALRRGAVLVNTARGMLVDSEALLESIESGHLAGAALDVTDPEPLPLDSELRRYPQVLLTPHAAFYDEDSLKKLQQYASEEGHRALNGETLRCRVA